MFKSMATLNREIDFIGGTSKCNTYLQYNGESTVKVFFDIEWMQDTPVEAAAALIRITEQVIKPVMSALFASTGHSQVADEIVIEQCHRPKEGRWKASFHVIFPDFCCKANALSAMADGLDLPEYVDRTPFTGAQRPTVGFPKYRSSLIPRHWLSYEVFASNFKFCLTAGQNFGTSVLCSSFRPLKTHDSRQLFDSTAF